MLKHLLILLLFYSVDLIAQTKVMQPFCGLPSFYQTATIEVDSFSLLPKKIQLNAKYVIDSLLTDFTQNVKFVKGQIIDIEMLLNIDSTISIQQVYEKSLIPKFQLFFLLQDSTIDIDEYCFEMSFDQYGQLTYIEWPRYNHGIKKAFIPFNKIIKSAKQIARMKGFRTKSYQIEYKFDDLTDNPYWEISFLQKSSGNNYNYSKEFKSIGIDVLSGDLIHIQNMNRVGVSCGGR
ncbi:MAG: hypothetical protein V4658_06685 [Bacteroidota bacterium]